MAVGLLCLFFGASATQWNDKYVSQHNASPGLLPALLPDVLTLLAIYLVVTGAVKWWRARRSPDTSANASQSRTLPAAWYADPTGKARLRYWDGAQWTDHTAT